MTASEGEFLHLAGDTVGQVGGLYAGCPVRGGRGRGGPRLLLAGEGGHTAALLQVALQLLQPRQPANIISFRIWPFCLIQDNWQNGLILAPGLSLVQLSDGYL